MLVKPLFRDRVHAGQVLAKKLKDTVAYPDAIVLALPRGGVPVGFKIAEELQCDLDVFLVRKIGVPGQEELAMGAIASGGVRVLNEEFIQRLDVLPVVIERSTARERLEIARRERLYREGRHALSIQSRTAILVDDGLATGASMLAAARAVRTHRPKRIIVAVPVASHDACEDFRHHVDQVVCAYTPEPFHAVGVWYEDFSQTSDAEVRELLGRAWHEHIT